MAAVEDTVTKASGVVGCEWDRSQLETGTLCTRCPQRRLRRSRMGTLELSFGKDVLKRGLECGRVWEEMPTVI